VANIPPPVIATEVPGSYLTAAVWNANIYNGLTYNLNRPHFVARQATAQSFTSGTNTVVTWDNIDVDSYGGYNGSVDATKYTVQAAGWYLISYAICWANNTTGNRAVYVQKNGSSLTGSWSSAAASSSYPTCNSVFRALCAVGDTLQIVAQQGSGGSLSTANPGVGGPWWSVIWDHA
jgi:hypothetical protein